MPSCSWVLYILIWYFYMYYIILSKFHDDLTVLPNPGIMVYFREIIPNGPTFQVRVRWDRAPCFGFLRYTKMWKNHRVSHSEHDLKRCGIFHPTVSRVYRRLTNQFQFFFKPKNIHSRQKKARRPSLRLGSRRDLRLWVVELLY